MPSGRDVGRYRAARSRPAGDGSGRSRRWRTESRASLVERWMSTRRTVSSINPIAVCSRSCWPTSGPPDVGQATTSSPTEPPDVSIEHVAIAAVGDVSGARQPDRGGVADRGQVARRRRHDLVDGRGDGELLGEPGQGVRVAHGVGAGVDALDGAGDQRAERAERHLIGRPERLVLVEREPDDAERGAVGGDQRHGGGGAQPACPDVGEEIGVGVLVGVQVVDRDDLGAAHGLGGRAGGCRAARARRRPPGAAARRRRTPR